MKQYDIPDERKESVRGMLAEAFSRLSSEDGPLRPDLTLLHKARIAIEHGGKRRKTEKVFSESDARNLLLDVYWELAAKKDTDLQEALRWFREFHFDFAFGVEDASEYRSQCEKACEYWKRRLADDK